MNIDELEAAYDRLFEALDIAIRQEADLLAYLIKMAVYEIADCVREVAAR